MNFVPRLTNTYTIMGCLILFLSGPMILRPGEDVLLGLLPMYHIYGLVIVLFGCIAKGAKLIMLPKFEPQTFLESIQKHKVRIML